jgi:hypothetical protein
MQQEDMKWKKAENKEISKLRKKGIKEEKQSVKYKNQQRTKERVEENVKLKNR